MAHLSPPPSPPTQKPQYPVNGLLSLDYKNRMLPLSDAAAAAAAVAAGGPNLLQSATALHNALQNQKWKVRGK